MQWTDHYLLLAIIEWTRQRGAFFLKSAGCNKRPEMILHISEWELGASIYALSLLRRHFSAILYNKSFVALYDGHWMHIVGLTANNKL